MKIKKVIGSVLAASAIFAAMSVGASAADYHIDAVTGVEYYPSTSYEGRYGASYMYGSANVSDFEIPTLPYGIPSTASIGVMEKVQLPGITAVGGAISGVVGVPDYIGTGGANGVDTPQVYPGILYQKPAYTSVRDMERKDGSIGTLKIPTLDINMKVWEGETNASMSKGLGHYSSTSGWDGNVGVCGHNRGAKYVIGDIKDLEIGDTITYTTVYGTRTYAVSMVKTISNTDWTYLQATADNRITITTCLANQPEKRICVQAVEIT